MSVRVLAPAPGAEAATAGEATRCSRWGFGVPAGSTDLAEAAERSCGERGSCQLRGRGWRDRAGLSSASAALLRRPGTSRRIAQCGTCL